MMFQLNITQRIGKPMQAANVIVQVRLCVTCRKKVCLAPMSTSLLLAALITLCSHRDRAPARDAQPATVCRLSCPSTHVVTCHSRLTWKTELHGVACISPDAY